MSGDLDFGDECFNLGLSLLYRLGRAFNVRPRDGQVAVFEINFYVADFMPLLQGRPDEDPDSCTGRRYLGVAGQPVDDVQRPALDFTRLGISAMV